MFWPLAGLLLLQLSYSAKSDDSRASLRIFNGETASAGEFPFVGLILADGSFSSDGQVEGQNMCGGSILSSRVILTAAHCVVKDTAIIDANGDPIDELFNPRNLQFHVGETDLIQIENTEQVLNIAGIVVHESYNSYTVQNDIALIITDEEITLNANVATIALPEVADKATLYADGAAITVIGWGTTEKGETSNELMKLPYTITAKTDCVTNYGGSLLDGMMCSGTTPLEKRAGTGDSGGPLFTKKDNKWVQLGLVSWGPPEITATDYDVNTDVLFFRDWINTHMNKALTEYLTSVTATSSVQTVSYTTLRNYLYKAIHYTPQTASSYIKITIKSGKLKAFDFLMIYDGDSAITGKMLAQLSGTLTEQTFTSTTTKGLTVAVVTGKEGVSDGYTLEYSEVTTAGTNTDLVCATGYAACTDKFYCLNTQLFCDAESKGNCRDGSDEKKCPDRTTDTPTTDGDNGSSSLLALQSFLVVLVTTIVRMVW